MSNKEIYNYVESRDCCIMMGVQITDTVSGKIYNIGIKTNIYIYKYIYIYIYLTLLFFFSLIGIFSSKRFLKNDDVNIDFLI